MSTDTLPAVEGETHVTNGIGMGGTESDGQVRVDGEQQETAEGVEVTEGETPSEEPQEETPAVPQMSAEEIQNLRAQVQQSDQIADIVMRDPERQKLFREWAAKDRGEVSPSDVLSGVDTAVVEHFQRPEDREALGAIFKPFREEIASLRREIASLRPKVEQAHASSVAGLFAKSLTENGLNGDIFKDKGFLRHMSELRRDPQFQSDERARPSYAAKFAAATWKSKAASRTGNVAARETVDRVKNGRLHGAASVGANGTSKVIEIDDTRPGWDRDVLAMWTKDPKARIEFKSSKK